MKMKSIFKSLSGKVPSSAVAPLPIRSSFDQNLTAELDVLTDDNNWVLNALHASAITQQITLDSLSNISDLEEDSDRKIIEEYLDFNVKLLDTCNELSEKIEIIKKYTDSLKIVTHLFDKTPQPATSTSTTRAKDILDSCFGMEKTCDHHDHDRSGSKLRKSLSEKRVSRDVSSNIGEILSMSRTITSTACVVIGAALSFKSKNSWSCSLKELAAQKKLVKESNLLMELQQTMKAAKDLKEQLKSKKSVVRIDVEELKRCCAELEDGIKPFEGRVRDLYKHLIDVRMALLGILSHL